MEIPGNKYLHKKFKKQTNCTPTYQRPHEAQEAAASLLVGQNDGQNKSEAVGQKAKEEDENGANGDRDVRLVKDNNERAESVPNLKSTNCEFNNLIVNSSSRQNLHDSRVINNCANFVLDKRSSISNVDSAANYDIVETTILSATTISIADSAPAFADRPPTAATASSTNDLKENHFSFDTKTCNASAIVEKSSTLDSIAYANKFHGSLLAERPSLPNEPAKSFADSQAQMQVHAHTQPPELADKKCGEPTRGKYVCPYCNLACSKPSVLQKHIRAHTNERPYPCVSCEFSFKTRSNLYKHCRSRTHANRVMGNKHSMQAPVECADLDSSSEKTDEAKPPREAADDADDPAVHDDKSQNADQRNTWEQTKSKPYKPKFHTAKLFFEEASRQSAADADGSPGPPAEPAEPPTLKTNPDLLKMRINELINKNNSIVNSDEAAVIRRRAVENGFADPAGDQFAAQPFWQQPAIDYAKPDEPLNLTSKNRKRCLSDSENTHKSLIKELLLKNLSSDPNLQCQYCRTVFQSVPELEMHKLKYCNAHKGNHVRYARSSSVNVASILTNNKNAFDNIPHVNSSTFSLKSPGPFLGKTRLIENDRNDKHRTFSFDDNAILQHAQPDSPSFSKYMLHSPSYSPLSPQVKKNPVKLFGGEVKITQTSGETKSYKIESESISKLSEEPQGFMDFGSKISENLVIKSSLHSGGTVLQTKSSYGPKGDGLSSPNILRYDNSNTVSPNLNLSILNDNKFAYDKLQPNDRLLAAGSARQPVNSRSPNADGCKIADPKDRDDKELFKSNVRDFTQKAIKLITPNLKPPNLTIPGLPVPLMSPMDLDKDSATIDNFGFARKQISLQQKMPDGQQSNIYNPVNLLVNGKIIRYVPGMPGPVVDAPVDFPAVVATKIVNRSPKEALPSPRPSDEPSKQPSAQPFALNGANKPDKPPTIIIDQHEARQDIKSQVCQKIKMEYERRKEQERNESRLRNQPENERKTTPLTVAISSPDKTAKEVNKKFVRPNSLALKPSSVSLKSHHGLTPTMFNQALISPDTPRVAKKYCQQYLNGNYFSYLGLKSSTKSVYCTLNKTQPFYVKHFKKLSMYSEWRQQESKIDSLSVAAYDSRQRQTKFTTAGTAKADLTVHSSYKFVTIETSSSKDENSSKNNQVPGGYESNEDYTYIRGRGRGRYVCDQCGIRCKKPSMLKKHIRTHSDDRPYTCQHCNFSFKTKGNLTKHMKSKAHSKKYAETSSTSTQNSATTSSESEESDAESSDESTRLQEHEAAHCLLSLAQKNTPPPPSSSLDSANYSAAPTGIDFPSFLKDDKFLKNSDQITQVTNTNFAKNKIMDETTVSFSATKHLTEVADAVTTTAGSDNISQYLGKSWTVRPLTYPYQQTSQTDKVDDQAEAKQKDPRPAEDDAQRQIIKIAEKPKETYEARRRTEETAASTPVIVKQAAAPANEFSMRNLENSLPENIVVRKRKLSSTSSVPYKAHKTEEGRPMDLSTVVVNESLILDLSPASATGDSLTFNGAFLRRDDGLAKLATHSPRPHSDSKSIDPVQDTHYAIVTGDRPVESYKGRVYGGSPKHFEFESSAQQLATCGYGIKAHVGSFAKNAEQDAATCGGPQEQYVGSKPRTNSFSKTYETDTSQSAGDRSAEQYVGYVSGSKSRHSSFSESNSSETFSQSSDVERFTKPQDDNVLYNVDNPSVIYKSSGYDQQNSKHVDYDQDQSAMQTLAEIAIKQMKTEKNILAKSVASEYLKLALKNEYNSSCDANSSDGGMKKFVGAGKDSNEMIVKSEENKNCSICSKNFSKPSQLRLHMNIHYLERPFKCESCSVSFRTKGHLQKHERSAGHHNKLSTSPALSSSEPRPFKCKDCSIAFRIHGHLAKHLRSKMHIMKLECLAKIPFGLYAELERANSLLTEINTTDGELCLESLKVLARKLFNNDPNKLDQLANVSEGKDS